MNNEIKQKIVAERIRILQKATLSGLLLSNSYLLRFEHLTLTGDLIKGLLNEYLFRQDEAIFEKFSKKQELKNRNNYTNREFDDEYSRKTNLLIQEMIERFCLNYCLSWQTIFDYIDKNSRSLLSA